MLIYARVFLVCLLVFLFAFVGQYPISPVNLLGNVGKGMDFMVLVAVMAI